jgi:hypothetical protein
MCYIDQSKRMSTVSAQSGARGRRLALCALALLTAVPVLHAQTGQALRVVPLVRADQVLVAFELKDGFSPEVRAAIHSGLKTTFTYQVDLRLDVTGWIDRTIASTVVSNSVEYDNLTRVHSLERRIDGRVEVAKITDNDNEVREWMTNVARRPLFQTSVLQPNRDYYVRVTASARPSNGSILWPFGSGTSAQTKFTFIR